MSIASNGVEQSVEQTAALSVIWDAMTPLQGTVVVHIVGKNIEASTTSREGKAVNF